MGRDPGRHNGSRGQLGERGEAHQLQEPLSSDQERGPSTPAKARVVDDEAPGEERVDDPRTVGAADVADVGAGDGLLVGDDGQHFEGCL